MITIDVYVPYLNASYDFGLDEAVPISSLIGEIAALICQKEHWPMPVDADRLALYDPANKRALSGADSLLRAGVRSGQRLILC